MMEQIQAYFSFTSYEIIGLSLFFLIFLIQVYLYVCHYMKPYRCAKKRNEEGSTLDAEKQPFVSIIVSSENESDNLSEHLPLLLEQDYPNFEVIVVNNGSTDESDNQLNLLQQNYPNLYHTYLPGSSDRSFDKRKLSLTIGIKAAKGDVLLFTEPYCKPVSDKWIASMMEELAEGKDIVLGYSYYSEYKGLVNRMARFDNLLFSLDYMSMALRGCPFAGVYRNVAFKKKLFFENKGFASCLNLESGENVFLNMILNETNTAVALLPDSFVETKLDTYNLWKQIKSSYSVAKSRFEKSYSRLYLDVSTRCMFYIAFILLMLHGIHAEQWGIVGISSLLFVVRSIIVELFVRKCASYFAAGPFLCFIPALDVLQPLYNLLFRTRPSKKRR